MGYKYSIWLIPNNWEYIKQNYKTEHIPHITIKTLMTAKEVFQEVKKFKKHYMISYEENVYDFNEISYHKDEDKDKELPACGFFCKIKNLKLEHEPHMTLYYHYHNLVLHMKPPVSCLGKVYVVNTISDDPKKWQIYY